MYGDRKRDQKYVFKYPWLPGGRELFEPIVESDDQTISKRKQEQNLQQFLREKFEIHDQLQVRLNRIIIYALEKRESGYPISETQFNVDLFYILKAILAAYNNRIVENHVANFVSKSYYEELRQCGKVEIDNVATRMNLRTHLIRKKIRKMIYNFSVDFNSYIPASSLLKDPQWSIINRFVDNGQVYLLKDNVARLLQEKIRRIILPKKRATGDLRKILEGITEIRDVFNTIDNKLALIQHKKKKYKGTGDLLEDERPHEEMFPPCIKYILHRASNGVNLSHTERLHIAFFYANINYSVEETVDVFRTVPDFDEKIARYNVEFSRGINGKGKKYSVYNCQKLKSERICKAGHPVFGDEICSKGVMKKGEKYHIKSPLEFLFWKRVELRRKNRDKRRRQAVKKQKGEE